MSNYFEASNGDNKVRCSTPQTAVSKFLQTYRNRSLVVMERTATGIHERNLFETTPNCHFYRSFSSRADAKMFAEAA